MISRFIADEDGATAIEYGLIVALLAVAIIGAMTFLGETVSNKFSAVASNISGAGG